MGKAKVKSIFLLLKRILQGQVQDIKVPKENIGENKEFKWRSSSKNGEPILIHNESGTAVAGAGLNITQSGFWVKPKQEKPDLEYVDSIPSGIHKGKPGVKYTTKGGDVFYMNASTFKEEELKQMKGYSENKQEPLPKPKNVLIQKVRQPSFEKYKNFRDAYTSLQQEGHDLENFEKLEKFPWQHMATVVDSMRTFAQEFSGHKLNLGIARTIPLTSCTMFSVGGAFLPQDLMTPSVILFFKPKVLTTRQSFNYQKRYFEREMVPNPTRGLHPPNQTVASSVYHELWHALGNEIIRQVYDKKSRQERAVKSDRQFAAYYQVLNEQKKKLSYAICRDALLYNGIDPKKNMKKSRETISDYALVDYDETIAEAFCDVYANGEEAAEYSIQLYKMAKKYAAMSPEEIRGAINNV